MICSACHASCSLSSNGLCRRCRDLATLLPSRRRKRAQAQRWIAAEYRDIRIACGLKPEQAMLRSAAIIRELRLILPLKVIVQWGLDNPYMAKHARRTMVNYVLREGRRVENRKKPVQSVRLNSTRKAVAA